MTISDSLAEAKNALAEVKKKHQFKKANQERQKAVQLQSDMAKCRGKLEICKNDFDRTIRTQCNNIRKGQRDGMDTLLQEQILWNAALGYLLVRDAIYALQTINSYDSVQHAYEMLEQATLQLTKPGKKGSVFGADTKKERNEYGYITSRRTRKEKERMLELMFDKLKLTGDIEQCIEELNHPQTASGSLSEFSSLDQEMNRLRNAEKMRQDESKSKARPAGLDDFYSPSEKE